MTDLPSQGAGQTSVLVVGECLVDLAPAAASPSHGTDALNARPFVALPGGGPANIAVGLARLGAHSAFAGRFSDAGFGPWLREHLEANGVDLRPSVPATQPATLAVVTLDEQGKASYAFYGPETADWHWGYDELPAPELVTSGELAYQAVQIGSLATAFEPGAGVIARWLEELRAGGRVSISFDPNVRAGLVSDMRRYRETIESFVARAHLVKASSDDLDVLYPGASVGDAARRWLAAGARVVVVTLGGDGAEAFLPDGSRVTAAPPAVEVVDTIGAGDSFSAAMLDFLGRRGELSPAALAALSATTLEAALRHAVTASAITCTRAGANPPTAAELADYADRTTR
jgi:fructokinase